MNAVSKEDLEGRLVIAAQRAEAVLREIERVYLGPSAVPELLLTALLARGHALLEGVPGVAKTTLAKAFAGTVHGNFRRIQFTPDLLPADITGTYVLSPQEGRFELRLGPIFANVVLGDEINRAPAKTQSALLEAMQEGQVTIDGETHSLPTPFIVIATQNPVEQAGTYPLPEAQVDRFLIRVIMGYPSLQEEFSVLQRFGSDAPHAQQVLDAKEVLELQSLVDQIHVEASVIDYVVRLSDFTRHHHHVHLGASPRASLSLLRAIKARALITGRAYATPDDVKALAPHVLAHRIMLTADAHMDGEHAGNVISEALMRVGHRRER